MGVVVSTQRRGRPVARRADCAQALTRSIERNGLGSIDWTWKSQQNGRQNEKNFLGILVSLVFEE